MKRAALMGASVLVALFFLSSCSSLRSSSGLRSGNAVQAAFETDSEGWVTKYVPGAKTLSNLIPPPNEARVNWDSYYETRSRPSKGRDLLGTPF